MAISIDYGATWIIDIPQADLTLISGSLYELDTDVFRLALKDLEDNEAGIAFPDTHTRNAPVTVAGVTFAQTIEILAPYSVRFENGTYSVRLVGSNNNIFDVEAGILVQNTVQVIPTNSAGLILKAVGSALTTEEAKTLTNIFKLARNKIITDPVAGTLTVYDDDNVTVLFQGNLFQDAAGVTSYVGAGAERREQLKQPSVFSSAFTQEFA